MQSYDSSKKKHTVSSPKQCINNSFSVMINSSLLLEVQPWKAAVCFVFVHCLFLWIEGFIMYKTFSGLPWIE